MARISSIATGLYTTLVVVCLSMLLGCSDSGSSSSSSSSDTITLSGKAVGNTDDVDAVATLSEKSWQLLARFNPVRLAWAAVDTGSDDNASLANATVTLYKVYGDNATPDEQVDIGTVITDSSGDYSIANLEAVPESTGESTDFYYEVRVAKGDLELKAPVATGEDATVNISPETDLAAKILTDVVDVPGVDNPPLPSNTIIEATRELVLGEAAALENSNAIRIPSALEPEFADNSLAAANGVAANGGNIEKLFKAANFSAEYLALTTSDSTTDAQATGYIDRVVREGCNQADGDYLPQPIAEAFGAYFNAGSTLTPTQIITAYNANFSGPDLDTTAVVNNFIALIEDAAQSVASSAISSTAIDDDNQMALYVLRSLDAASFTASTALAADQALAFIQYLGSSPCVFTANLDLFAFIADLLDRNALRAAAIAQSNIYHNSGFGCDEGAGKGHFVADIKVYRNGKTVDSVVLESSDPDGTVLGGDGEETLTFQSSGLFERYTSNTDGVCVNLGKEVEYTLTVTFNDATTVVGMVSRKHPRIPEASSSVYVADEFVSGSADSGNPTVVPETRPLYQWTSPADMLTAIINDGANTAISADLASSDIEVKYTYEFSHVDTLASPVGPAPECASVSSGALYSVDSFIPTEDCDIEACATALSVDASQIACRMNIQSYLVNRNDKILGQAAGHFRFFCVDTDDDGFCG